MTVQARGKLLLFGEHAAVYGHPAVGLSLPWLLTVTLAPAPRWELPGLGPYEDAVRSVIDRLDSLAAEFSHPRPQPGRLEFVTEIPVGNGFGSSAALCAALVNLFFPSLSLSEKDLLAWRAEALFHGTPSGIDTALALRRGWWSLDTSTRPVTARQLPDPGLVLVVGAVARQGDTKGLVASVAQRRNEGDPSAAGALDSLGQVSTEAVALLKAGQTTKIAPLIRCARAGLQTLGLEPPPLTNVIEAGLSCPGALAGKLSGAGGGGAFFVLFDSAPAARLAIPKITQALPDSQWTCRPRMILDQI